MHTVINFNKPSGITSFQAVKKIQHITGARKAGHTGTLDPMATGVLLVCLNEATKISRFISDMDKKYIAKLKLGERTNTFDSEGRIIEKNDISRLTMADIFKAVNGFTGKIKQKPPMYSAVKINGKPLYKLARNGVEIERSPREIEIYDLKVTSIEMPFIEIEIACSKGTYVRTLCDDIGQKLGTGAHLVSLIRTAVGHFNISESITLEELEDKGDNFISIDDALSWIQEIMLSDEDYRKAMLGQKLIINNVNKTKNGYVRLKGVSGKLFAIGNICNNVITIERILHL